MGLIRRYIRDIYDNEKKTLPIENLKFSGMVIFRFRNIKDYRRVK
jgi:hypothetical protein